jgi:hypothetical protein
MKVSSFFGADWQFESWGAYPLPEKNEDYSNGTDMGRATSKADFRF